MELTNPNPLDCWRQHLVASRLRERKLPISTESARALARVALPAKHGVETPNTEIIIFPNASAGIGYSTDTSEESRPRTIRTTEDPNYRIIRALRLLFEPDAPLQKGMRTRKGSSYHTLRLLDASGKSYAEIAEAEEANNAIYVWRKDHCTAPADEALGDSKQYAREVGCIRIPHIGNDESLINKVLAAVTEPVTG